MFVFQNGTSYYLLWFGKYVPIKIPLRGHWKVQYGFQILRITKTISASFQSAYWLSSFDAYLSAKCAHALDVDLRVIQQTTKCTSWFSEYESRSCKSKAALISNCPLKSNGRHIPPKLYVQCHCNVVAWHKGRNFRIVLGITGGLLYVHCTY